MPSLLLICAVAKGNPFPYLLEEQREQGRAPLDREGVGLEARESIDIFTGRLRGLRTINCEGVTGDLKTDIVRSSLAIIKICLQLPSKPSVLFPCVAVSWGR